MSGRPVTPLCGGDLDSAAHHRRDPGWLSQAWRVARIVGVGTGGVLVVDRQGVGGGREPRLATLAAADLPADVERYFLGVDRAGTPCFAARVPVEALTEPGCVAGARFEHLRVIGEALPAREAALAATAVALHSWHHRTRYSPQSGKPTVLGQGGWVRTTEDGTETLWPRTDPAVITLVRDGAPGNACLLANNANWGVSDRPPLYSCLAGFVEPGESIERAVAREIEEEVGVRVRDVRYVASQPWPFPCSLMLGFTAVADPAAELRLDDTEITAARWFTRDEVAEALAGGSDISLPLGTSIARYLIERWVAKEPGS